MRRFLATRTTGTGVRSAALRRPLGLVVLAVAFMVATHAIAASGAAEESTPGAGGDSERAELREITFVLDWLPNTNHAGLYLAIERGWFAEEGLSLEVVQPSEVGSDALVASGAGEFGVSHQEAVTYARTAESPVPVVAIATILQHNTSGYAIPADRGATSPGDLAGLRYGGWGTEYEDAMLNAILEPYGSSASDVTTVNIGTMDIFAGFQREIDFTWIFYGWDGVRAELEGIELDYFPLTDLDPRLDYYTPVIITGERMIREEPQTVEAVLRALARGYEAAAAEPEAAAEALRVHAPEIDAELARESLAYLAPFFVDDSGAWGSMERDVWTGFTDFMVEQELLERPLAVDAAFTNEFLPR